jgi:hypothetical protein
LKSIAHFSWHGPMSCTGYDDHPNDRKAHFALELKTFDPRSAKPPGPFDNTFAITESRTPGTIG